jgi:hypothetical protein
VPRPTPRPALAAALLAASIVALCAAPPARAALAVQVSVEGLARTSEAVVRGVVQRRTGVRAGSRIYTEVEVRAADVWRGAAPAVVKVQVPGGVVGDVGQRVDASPLFADGEEVVLFLARPGGRAWRVNGLAQGKFRVEGGQAKPDVSRLVFHKREVEPGERAAEPMTVAELERRVREVR